MANQKKKIPRYYLQLNMKLGNDRYRVDDLFGDNGLVVTYKGYDTFRKRAVVIRELYPSSIVDRNIDQDYLVFCKQLSNEHIFISMKEHMARKAKKLIQLYPVEGIANVLTAFEERGTIYVVEEFVEGISMKEFYYKRHSAKFTVEDIMKIIGPVMDTLKYLHSKNVVHGTVYPDHIYITPERKIVLTGITSPIEDVSYEVLGAPSIRKDGFSPVELYVPQSDKGNTIDIYEVAAIFYRYVTGDELPAYYLRINEDDKQTEHPVDMKLTIMQHQADAIMKALSIYSFDRYQTIDEFRDAIWPDEVLPILEQQDQVVYQGKKDFWYSLEEKKKNRYYTALAIAIIIAAIVVIPAFGTSIKKMQVAHFYRNLVEASVEQKCISLLEMNDKQRQNFTNNYAEMNNALSDEQLSKQFVAKYYDMIIKRIVSQSEYMKEKKIYEYVRIDYRKDEIILLHNGNDVYEELVVERNPKIDGTYKAVMTTKDEKGNLKSENVFVKP